MGVRETTLKDLIQGEKQFRVPLYQRQYSWKRDQHETLWSDILDQYELVMSNHEHAATHFLGSVVLAQIPTAASDNVGGFRVIDGQQRLTTLLLALCAIRDRAAAIDDTQFEVYTHRFLVNQYEDPHSDRRHRLVPTDADRGVFRELIDTPTVADREGVIGAAYRFFYDRVAGTDRQGELIDLERLTQVITTRLTLVDITTGPQDNAHRIFESLNATGVNLTQADLLRNYLFMVLGDRADRVYEQTWRPMEQVLGLEHLEGLARLDLQRRGQEVTHDKVYFAQRSRLDKVAHDLDAVENEIKDLALRARHYKRLLEPSSDTEPDPIVRRHLVFLRRWGATTSYPLLMHVYGAYHEGECTVEQLRRVVAYVESFIVRRHLAAVPTNFLNKLFITAIDRLPNDLPIDEAVHRVLSASRNYWTSDEKLRSAIHTNSFYLTGRQFQPLLEKAGLANDGFTIHSLRHTFATTLAEKGVHPSTAQKMLGHSDIRMTLAIYTHATDGMQDAATQALEEAFS